MSRNKRIVNGLLNGVYSSSYVQANLVFRHSKSRATMKKENSLFIIGVVAFVGLAWGIIELLHEIKHPLTH